ncbi:class I SAM-dependent methyltransferase [Candidatus Omnitrophota bacterium]
MKKDIERQYTTMAKNYDETIKKIIPEYNKIIKTMVELLPFDKNQAIDVLDIGCGTGTVAAHIKKKFFHSAITCLDPTQKMLLAAKKKMKNYLGIKYVQTTIEQFPFKEKYHAVCASMVFQNIQTKKEKRSIFKKIFKTLNDDGVFLYFGPVKGSNERIEEMYMKKWSTFLQKSFSLNSSKNDWVATYKEKDTQDTLLNELDLLTTCGFKSVDIITKNNNFALFTASKS